MTVPRVLVSAVAAVLMLASLTACVGGAPGATLQESSAPEAESTVDLGGTAWSGTDSGGDTWTLGLEPDGSVWSVYNDFFNAATTGSWAVSGGALTVRIEYPTYVVEMVGDAVAGPSIDLAGTYPGGSFDLTITDATDSLDTDLTGTSWSGTDSDGDDWSFVFESDGTVGVELNGQLFDEPADVWTQDGPTVSIRLAWFENGDIDFSGRYFGRPSMELGGEYADQRFTLTVTRS